MKKSSTFVKAIAAHRKQTISNALAIVSADNVATSARSLVAATSILLTALGIRALMEWMGLL